MYDGQVEGSLVLLCLISSQPITSSFLSGGENINCRARQGKSWLCDLEQIMNSILQPVFFLCQVSVTSLCLSMGLLGAFKCRGKSWLVPKLQNWAAVDAVISQGVKELAQSPQTNREVKLSTAGLFLLFLHDLALYLTVEGLWEGWRFLIRNDSTPIRCSSDMFYS